MKQRIITALILLAICIPVLLLGGIVYVALISIIGLMGFDELIKLKMEDKNVPVLIRIFSYILLLLVIISSMNSKISGFVIDYRIVTLVIFLLTIPIIFYKDDKYNIVDALFLIGSIFFIGIGFSYFIIVRNMGLTYLLFLLLVTIFTDTFAYITGCLIGKHHMAPNVSPKKTWEGFFGGLILGTFVSTSFYYTAIPYDGSLIVLIIVIALLSIIGQIGDLVFSAIKRHFNVKDYSNLLPGHGGILDRVDSILFVILAFSFISSYLL